MDSRQLPERRAYVLTHVVEHLKAAGACGRLFTMLEERGFLAEQAAALDGFQQGSRDLESQVLPVTIERADWQRFLRYLLVTLNFRGLAEALAEEEILRALVQHGRGTLAAHIATQLTEPQARARARAVILGVAATPELEQKGTNTEELQRLVEDLDAVPKATDDATAEAWCETLRTIARHLGPSLRHHWPGWIGRLPNQWEALAVRTW